MNTSTFRPASNSDCRTIASLYSISSDGVADYIWSKLAKPGQDILDVGQHRYERENTLFSYRNCTLAEVDSAIAGMLVAFPLWADGDDAPETDPVLAPYSRLEEDASFYVCGVALFPEYRRLGIGSQFMQQAEDSCRKQGLEKLSLVVFEQNTGAKRLYEALGYRERSRAAIVPHPLIHLTGDALLMLKQL
jgi:ribosomal protein S18 acetylase RimI-like enzyme